MPNIFKHKTRKNYTKRFFLVIIMCVCIVFSVFCANIMSNFITVGSFSLSTNINQKSSSFSIFAINSGTHLKKENAEACVTDLQKRGGAGYIWSSSGAYHVLIAGYENQNDAKKVQENLQTQGLNYEILELKFQEIEIAGNLSNEEKTAINNAVASFKTTFVSLYDLAVAIDTKVATEGEVSMTLSTILDNVSTVRTLFDGFFKTKFTSDLMKIKIKLTSQKEELERLIENRTSESFFSSKIKYSYFSVLRLRLQLFEEINEII